METLLIKVSLLALLIFDGTPVQSIEPVTSTIAVGVAVVSSAFLAGFDLVKCQLFECCDDRWVKPNITGLRDDLNNKLYGQHLVIDTIVRQIKGHLSNPEPSKALVLSFHGWTGGGKNYVTSIIADNLYRQKVKSNFVHQYVATLHFPHVNEVETYRDQLRDWIKGNVSTCSRSLFIFDEMDKMPVGLIDTLKPYLDHYPHINNVNYRKSIFIFLSNTAGNDITEKTIKHWQSGKKREDITLASMEEVITLAAYNEKRGGLWHSSLIEKNLISAFVPFLPLERHHVKQCAEDDIKKKGHEVTESIKNQVADELQYFPSDTKLFSKSGCKRVSEKVDLMLEEL